MKNYFTKKNIIIGTGILLLIAVFAGGFYLGTGYRSEEEKLASVINKDGPASVDFAPFWEAWKTLDEKYVPTSSTTAEMVSNQARVWGAIEGMTEALGDPYTQFFPPVEAKNFAEEISGNFEGVGMEVGIRDEVLTVVAPLKGTPSYRAGIKAGDRIIQIDKTPATKLSAEEAVKLIRGPKGTEVKIVVAREGSNEPLEFSVVRDVINIPTIDTQIKGDVFIIQLYNFSGISTNLFRSALRQFLESGKSNLIIYLRGNPGGYLEAAIDMASWFLPPGKVIVKEDFREEKDMQVYRSKGYDIFDKKMGLVILIDEGSASASEILAGALQENGVATLVGTQSFGKGSVQEVVPITSDTALKVTIARWLTPNGKSISNGGLTPDVIVELDEKEFAKGVDTQLNKALEILNQKR